jgi:rhamnosyltransferase
VARRRNGPLATVVIPTFNGERYLRRILEILSQQDLDGSFDILVIDSGSTDGTLDIVRDFPKVRLHQIPNSEFGHGRTRNLGAQMSTGEFTAFLTHDAVPTSTHWLANLIAPMRADPSVAAVMGKQVPRPGCFPLLKYEIRGVFANAGPDDRVTVFDKVSIRNEAEFARAAFHSDVNSAARSSVLQGPIPYRDVEYAEDQLFGRDVLKAGLRKAYAPMAVVEHSNDLTLREYGKRIFDETFGLRRLGLGGPEIGVVDALKKATRGTVGDARRIAHDPEYSWAKKIRWWLATPSYQFVKWRAIHRAFHVDLDRSSDMRHSLEAGRRGRANT